MFYDKLEGFILDSLSYFVLIKLRIQINILKTVRKMNILQRFMNLHIIKCQFFSNLSILVDNRGFYKKFYEFFKTISQLYVR